MEYFLDFCSVFLTELVDFLVFLYKRKIKLLATAGIHSIVRIIELRDSLIKAYSLKMNIPFQVLWQDMMSSK